MKFTIEYKKPEKFKPTMLMGYRDIINERLPQIKDRLTICINPSFGPETACVELWEDENITLTVGHNPSNDTLEHEFNHLVQITNRQFYTDPGGAKMFTVEGEYYYVDDYEEGNENNPWEV